MLRSEIQHRVRQLIRDHELGCEAKLPVWAGSDGEKPCAACGELINSGSVEYEVKLGTQILCFHPECHSIWQQECMQ